MRALAAGLALLAALWLGNSSTLWGQPGQTRWLAHRGVHQLFRTEGLTGDTCTATRILAPTHPFLENTLPSMAEAFRDGAEVVELDVHPTPDGHWAVIHDWTLDCRTNGQGVVRETPWAVIRGLDAGYGYTADGGQSFPFRGRGIGLIPDLDQVFAAFPEGQFLVNFKSSDPAEGAAFAAWLAARPQDQARVWAVYGGAGPARAAAAALPGLPFYDRDRIKDCLLSYVALGWSGHVPAACREGIVPVPANVGPYLWGWPHQFTARMRAAGSQVLVLGPWTGGDFSTGIDDSEARDALPQGLDALIWTNRIEALGPAVRN